jgi:Ion channel
MSRRLVQSPHVLLVAFLVTMLVLFPLVEKTAAGRSALITMLMVAGTVLALQRVQASRAGIWLITVLGALAVVTQILHAGGWPPPAGLVSALAQTAFYAVASVLMCQYMLRDTRATIDELFAAAAAYMLLALAWSMTYWSIEFLNPGAFIVTNPMLPERRIWFEFLYLSMTTLTTTGYGDIVPVSSAARSAVLLEQFVGVLYVALVISRLAGFAGATRDERA